MGVVHRATSASGLRIAVKVVHAQYAADPEFRARFRQEVNAARRVSGAFTAPVVDADPDAELPWMATLFIPGDTLAAQVKRDGALSTADVRRLGAGLAEALCDIHRAGVVHRDLKPSNVLLAEDGPKVIDFGISRPFDSELRTETGKLIGSPPFMAPEQFQRPREVGPAADVFAMGAVLAHAATGRGPFDSDSPYIVAYQVVHDEPDLSGVPDELVPVIRHCLAKDPAHRPSPTEVLEALRRPSDPPHVPAQRGPGPDERVPARRGGGSRGDGARPADSTARLRVPTEDKARTSGEARMGTTGAARLRLSGRRPRAILAAVAGVLLIGGVAALTTGALLPGEERQPSRPTDAKAGFSPWSVRLDTAGGTPSTCASGTGALFCVTDDGVVARLDPANGKAVWRRTTGARPKAPVAVSGGLLHLTMDHRLEALDPRTGKARWTSDTRGYSVVERSAAMTLLTSSDGRVRALDSATGRQVWSRRIGGPGTQWVAGDARTFFTATPTADGSVTSVGAVSASDGTVRWSVRVAGDLRPVAGGTSAVHLLSVGLDQLADEVVRIDTDDHAAHRFPLPTPVDQAEATESDGTVYVYAAGGALVAVDTRAGAKDAVRWRRDTAVSRPSRPVTVGGTLYFTAPDGRLLAVSRRTGAPVGQTRPRPDASSGRVVADLPSPVPLDGRIYATAPDGTVFGVDGSHPEDW
ncbi:serine/threonine-protein kinase [Streptomyces sp. VRA16 Mangrove soil]|uniref:serine/threonine-protein kinase n=1 Tax=Streptomyces sp. VRA16 Mangrove soil TaxID=2817434 RepID=UPI0027DDB586|nr:serine/threonine-protein kinase [Streptomyces sp. VRA16 Mangrove soil]